MTSMRRVKISLEFSPYKASNARTSVLQKNHQRTNHVDKDASSKSSQISSGNYDAKLVETINTAIVDRSPSVRWEDIGKILRSIYISAFLFLSYLLS